MTKHRHDIGIVKASWTDDPNVAREAAGRVIEIGHGTGVEIFVAKFVAEDDMEWLNIVNTSEDAL
jgi:hypothetical protein